MRYVPEWKAICAAFYIIPAYADGSGQEVTRGQQAEAECQAIVEGVTFAKLGTNLP